MGNQLQVGLLTQVAADAYAVIIGWVDAFNIYGFPYRQRFVLMGQWPVKQGFQLILGI